MTQQVSHEKDPGCLGYIKDYTIQVYNIGIIINHDKDHY